MQLNTAIILAGGFGTRLQNVVQDLPKPMAPVNGEPFLNYQLRYLKHFGINRVILCTGHLAEKIESYYGSSFEGIAVAYSREQSPLGTGGAVKMALQFVQEQEVLVLNGDSFFDLDLKTFEQQFRTSNASAAIALRRVDEAGRYGQIELDKDHRIVSFHEKSPEQKQGLINAGIYILNKKTFPDHTPGSAFSIEKDYFEKKCGTLVMKGFEYEGYFIDIGIPQDYAKAQNDFKGFKYQ